MRVSLKVILVILAVLIIIGVALPVFKICPPAGPWPTPPYCGGTLQTTCGGTGCNKESGSLAVVPMTGSDGTLRLMNVTVTVPYWTTGYVWLGMGENLTAVRLTRVNDVVYTGTVTARPQTAYYYSRGTTETKERPSVRQFTTSLVLDEVTDWQDSGKTIMKKDFQKSFYLGACHSCGVSFTKGNFIEPMKTAMDDIKVRGANWVNFVPTWFIEPDYRGSVIRPIYAAEFKGNTGWVTATISDNDLKTLISEAHKRGLKVYLVPHIAPEFWGPDVKGKGHIQPANPDAFFANYTAFVNHYADIAQETGVELYGVGNELDTITQPDIATSPSFNKEQKWRGVIASVRTHYTGPLTYSVSCSDEKRCGPELIPFWDALDVIGWEWYVPIASGPHESIPSMKQNAERIIANHIRPLSEKYKKPVVLTEFGWEAYPGSCAHTLGIGPSNGADRLEQAGCFEAVFQAIEDEDCITGMHIWTWTANIPGKSFDWVLTDTVGEVRFSITEDEIAKWYQKIES